MQEIEIYAKIKVGVKPCRFCGECKNLEVLPDPHSDDFAVCCRSCHARGPSGRDQSVAVSKWNGYETENRCIVDSIEGSVSL